ncbi:exported protein of unknown function [Azospirillum lipoferum 4B]|uniref:Uncharacterized protein n=2 Tax=Azospirillum lipoferum TaxID=193 RepID=G7Z1T6_AZOL4|nr:exported protein of unknown function [Azospirillum lipoferum 4B]
MPVSLAMSLALIPPVYAVPAPFFAIGAIANLRRQVTLQPGRNLTLSTQRRHHDGDE